MEKHANIFKEGLRAIQPFMTTLHLQPNTIPRFHRPRPLPFSIKQAIENIHEKKWNGTYQMFTMQ